jgi:hypothetical protein
VPVIERAANHLQEVQAAMNELHTMTGVITADIWSVFGVLAENKDVLRSLKYDLGHDATLMSNFVEVFMRHDHHLLLQSLREAEPDTRKKALALLDGRELDQWLADILDIKAPAEEGDDDELF